MAKRPYLLSKVYGRLEPAMMEFEPPLMGCVVSDRDHSLASRMR